MKISEFEKLKELIRNYIQLLEKEYFSRIGNKCECGISRDLNKLESW